MCKKNLRAYHIYFSSTIDRQHLKELAESDVKEVVQTVQEIFADYNPYSGKQAQVLPTAQIKYFSPLVHDTFE